MDCRGLPGVECGVDDDRLQTGDQRGLGGDGGAAGGGERDADTGVLGGAEEPGEGLLARLSED